MGNVFENGEEVGGGGVIVVGGYGEGGVGIDVGDRVGDVGGGGGVGEDGEGGG